MEFQREIARQTIDFIRNFDINERNSIGLSPLQLRVLSFVQERVCVKATDIAQQFNITPATVTTQIDNLEKTKWLRRCSNGNDRRVVNIKLTAKAKRELDTVVKETLSNYDWLFSPLNKEEQKILLSLFKKINSNAKRILRERNENE